MNNTILIIKETRAGERRVALTPEHVKTLIEQDHSVFVEQGAGEGAGYTDEAYQQAGATVRQLENDSISSYKNLFDNIDMIVRVKRPTREREKLEYQALSSGQVMIGALDPLEQNSQHIAEYQQAGIIAHSLDQLDLPLDHPMNVLAAMSKITGRLALRDAIEKHASATPKVVLIGFGVAGRAAFAEALSNDLAVTVALGNPLHAKEIKEQGGNAIVIERDKGITHQQEAIKRILVDADIIISSARKSNQQAPLLIPTSTLNVLQAGTVIVDLALSEGGNVAGSEHDTTHVLGNDVVVTNISGYPKSLPHEASQLWSMATLQFILQE